MVFVKICGITNLEDALAAVESGADALVEVHTKDEMRRARKAGATLIGVNNRDLHSFSVSLEVSVRLAQDVSEETILVTESGLSSAGDLRRLRTLGYRGFLIGETLMRSLQPEATLRELRDEGKAEFRIQNPESRRG